MLSQNHAYWLNCLISFLLPQLLYIRYTIDYILLVTLIADKPYFESKITAQRYGPKQCPLNHIVHILSCDNMIIYWALKACIYSHCRPFFHFLSCLALFLYKGSH